MPPSRPPAPANRAADSPSSPERFAASPRATAQATGEISAMIQGIQDRTRTAIASMASGNLIVKQGVVTTNQAGEALERIIGMAERVDRMIAQIAIAASQQAACRRPVQLLARLHPHPQPRKPRRDGHHHRRHREPPRHRQRPRTPGRPLPPRHLQQTMLTRRRRSPQNTCAHSKNNQRVKPLGSNADSLTH